MCAPALELDLGLASESSLVSGTVWSSQVSSYSCGKPDPIRIIMEEICVARAYSDPHRNIRFKPAKRVLAAEVQKDFCR